MEKSHFLKFAFQHVHFDASLSLLYDCRDVAISTTWSFFHRDSLTKHDHQQKYGDFICHPLCSFQWKIWPRKCSMIISLTKFSVIVLVKICCFFSGSSYCRSNGGIFSSVASYQVSERKRSFAIIRGWVVFHRVVCIANKVAAIIP